MPVAGLVSLLSIALGQVQWQLHPPPQQPPWDAPAGPACELPILTPTSEMRRMTRALAHDGQATVAWEPTSFSNSMPHGGQLNS